MPAAQPLVPLLRLVQQTRQGVGQPLQKHPVLAVQLPQLDFRNVRLDTSMHLKQQRRHHSVHCPRQLSDARMGTRKEEKIQKIIRKRLKMSFHHDTFAHVVIRKKK